jgi:Ca2+-binding EF-hand superfamily protein
MSYNDDDLRNAVNAVFDAYDKDKSGTLEDNEITLLINDALKHMGQGRQVTKQEVNQFISAVDKNNDGKVAKPELFEIFKRVVSNNSSDEK